MIQGSVRAFLTRSILPAARGAAAAVFSEYRAHLRLARRSWRIPALDWQTPLTITLAAPQPIQGCVIVLSG